MIELRKTAESPSTITFAFQPVPGCLGYRFTAEKQAKPTHTWDATRSSVKFSSGQAWYKVEALGVEDSGVYPPAAPPPPPPPPPPDPGAIVLDSWNDIQGLWLGTAWVSPVTGDQVHSSGGGFWNVDTPYGRGFRVVSTPQMRASWDVSSGHVLMRADVTEGREGQRQVSRFRFMLPRAGNPSGIKPIWHSGTFWEVGHMPASLGDASGHNFKVLGADAVVPPASFLVGVHRPPWAVGDFDWSVGEILRYDHWYEAQETVVWSVGSAGRYEFKLDSAVVAQKSGPTMPQAGAPYGPQFGWYSRIEAAYPYRNEIVFGPISISLS